MTTMAHFSGTCPDCGERWQPGDLIRAQAIPPGESPIWKHAACPDSAVDRTYPLADPRFAHANPDRVRVVIRRDPVTRFAVWRGTRRLREFVEHERAMTWAQGRAVLDRHPDAPRYRLDSPRKPAQDARTDAVGGPNYTHVISGPQNGSNEFDTFPEPMEAP